MGELFSLAGRVALVTGASRGLGLAMARAMAEAGAHVVLNGRYAETLDDRARELDAAGLSTSIAPFDIADEAAATAAIDDIIRQHGRLDILINNAAIDGGGSAAELDADAWRGVMDVNLNPCFTLSRQAARSMVAEGWGRIIMVASILSILARQRVVAYTTAKTALVGLTRALAVELGPKGVTCNAIAPGYFLTDMNATLVTDPEFDAMVRRRTPLGRWAEPEELGGAAVFLASDAASYVNGHMLTVDGGLTAAL